MIVRNPLSHVAPTPKEEMFFLAGGRVTHFRPLGLSAFAMLAERFPSFKAKMYGGDAEIVMGVEEADQVTAALIAIAVAPDDVSREELELIEASAAAMKPAEKEIAVDRIHKASIPDIEEVPNFPKPANRRTRRARKATAAQGSPS